MWPQNADNWEDRHFPVRGTSIAPTTPENHVPYPGSSCDACIECEIPVPLIKDVTAKPYRGAVGVAIELFCPVDQHIWLGPWDEETATQLSAIIRREFALPGNLGSPLSATTDELVQSPRDFSGKYITVEGQWRRPVQEEVATFAGGYLEFPDRDAEPKRSSRVRAEGIWLVGPRPGYVSTGTGRCLHALSVNLL